MNKRLIKAHLDHVAGIDAQLKLGLASVGYPASRVRPAGFETFFSTIVSQQISTQAANAIMGRLRILLPNISAQTVLAQPIENLRGAGMSLRKVEYAQGLAQAILSGEFDPLALADMSDDEAIEQIVALRGFGRWSAEIYLMFSLQRRDIFPADDLALQVALGRLLGLADKPTPKQARDLTAHWGPRRSACSLFLWHYYRGAPA